MLPKPGCRLVYDGLRVFGIGEFIVVIKSRAVRTDPSQQSLRRS